MTEKDYLPVIDNVNGIFEVQIGRHATIEEAEAEVKTVADYLMHNYPTTIKKQDF